MSGFLEKNLLALAQTHPDVARRVVQCHPESFTLSQDAAGHWQLQHQGKSLYAGDPQAMGEKDVATYLRKYPKLMVFYGVGLGFSLDAYLARENTITEHILVIEQHPEIFFRALQLRDWSKVFRDKRLHFLVGVPEAKLEEALVDYIRLDERLILIRTLCPIFDTAMMTFAGAYYLAAAKALHSASEYAGRWVGSPPEDNFHGFLNILGNLKQSHAMRPMEILEGRFKGRIGISVCTGPSLKYSFDWLRQIQDRAIIVSSDSALKILLREGITPHAVGCLERVPETELLFKDLPPLPNTWLITNPLIWPESIRKYPGPKIHFSRSVGQLRWYYPESHHQDMGNSVAHLNVHALIKMGCSSVMLVGQDLAYDRFSEKTHADGIDPLLYEHGQSYRKASEKLNQTKPDEACVMGNNGQPILTTFWYIQFRRYMETIIRTTGITCYNIIPETYGAKIEYAIRKNPEEALALISGEAGITARLHELLDQSPHEADQSIAKHQAWVHRQTEKAVHYFKKYMDASMRVLEEASAFELTHSPILTPTPVYDQFFKKIEKITESIGQDPDDFFDRFFLTQIQGMNFAISQLSHELMMEKLDPAATIGGRLKCLRGWYETVYYWASRYHHTLTTHPELWKSLSPTTLDTTQESMSA